MQIRSFLPLLLLAIFSGCSSPDFNAQLSKSIMGNNASKALEAIEGGADVNLVDPRGRTPLMDAVELPSREPIAQYLLTAGADPNLAPSSGPEVLAPLHVAIKAHQLKAAQLLLRHGADPNKVAQDQTPLMLASTTEEIKFLVKAGAKPNFVTPGGRSVMDISGPHASSPVLWRTLRVVGGKPRRPSWIPPGAKVVPAPWPRVGSPLNPPAAPPLR